MKSHLIPEPQPIDSDTRETDASHFMALDQAASRALRHSKTGSAREDDYHHAPEIPMRNFLRVVFVH